MRSGVSVVVLGSVLSVCLGSCGGDTELGGSSTGGAPADAQDSDWATGGTPVDANNTDSEGDGTSADAVGDADGGPLCQEEQAAMVAFVKASKSCMTDADCVFVYSRSDIREHCSGGFYLNKGYDKLTYSSLESAVQMCLGADSWACATDPDPPACWHGSCVNGGLLDGFDQCVDTMGGENACTLCFCPCGGSGCYGGCYALYTCVWAEGCLGKACDDATDPLFPCNKELAAAGGIGSGDYQKYQVITQCAADWQCVSACPGP